MTNRVPQQIFAWALRHENGCIAGYSVRRYARHI
jgi:hypothetical protein